MVNYYIYAKDFSGSTGGDKHYHSNGLKTLNQFKSDKENIEKELSAAGESPESKIIYLHWGSKCYEVDENTTVKAYEELQDGNMGTDPGTIVEWIQTNHNINDGNNKIKLLYIVTDGQIFPNEAMRCFKLNESMYYERVVFHAFNIWENRIDLSVAASFLKNQCMVYRNYELLDNVNISEEYDYGKVNLDNFVVEKENLKSYIKIKYINTFKHDVLALEEIEKLKNLRNRLFAELSSKSPHHNSDERNLNTKDKKIFLREFVETDWYKNLNATIYNMKVEVEKAITTLINYIVSEKKSYSFDALKFGTKFDNLIEEEPIVDVNFPAEQEIEFPDIILDDEKGIPVILLTEFNMLNKLIFHITNDSTQVSPASFNKFKSVMDCPLYLLNDSDISESIGYFYTLNVYKQLLTNTNKTEPRTRRPFHGGLVLIDTDEFDKYNDYILAATYLDFKKINYNVGLFYYILWKNCENKEWMDRNVVEQFKKYAMKRISRTVCKIGLSGLPLDPTHVTSLPTALWYCVELSSILFKNDPINFNHERLRMYYGVADYMIEILKYLDYDLDMESIEKRKDVIRHVMILKRIPTDREKLYYLIERIFKKVNGFLISEIENPCNIIKLTYLNLDHKTMIGDDAFNDDEVVHLNDYVHLLYFIHDDTKVGINEKTFRPFFTIDNNKSFYAELFKVTKNAVINNDSDTDKINITYNAIDSLEFDRLLSLYNLFIKCVTDSDKYPTLDEYTEYILKRKKYHGDLINIFPPNVIKQIDEVYSLYQHIITKVDFNEFINVCKTYVSRIQRVKKEGIIKFSNDKEIEEFISSEEREVNLKKCGPKPRIKRPNQNKT
ncbi:uncharacterized protein LOC125235707 [Leguminivora glycinivorella]|uniref:uncharacterized protein LOC125235707 n=1 Tax=Leguminivora glycinivorella TaxID=1035111 RepID=UPI00200C07F5|nr:uncharacterized protein LOC125235707 [Leguminivora glycinivorella]XP_047998230.1 uncharacterized protein LOC125235707 [Leguminivora glycinivorella]